MLDALLQPIKDYSHFLPPEIIRVKCYDNFLLPLNSVRISRHHREIYLRLRTWKPSGLAAARESALADFHELPTGGCARKDFVRPKMG